MHSFVEFETSADLKSAVEKLDGREFKGATVHCTPDVSQNPDELHVLSVDNTTRSKMNVPMLEVIDKDHHQEVVTVHLMTMIVDHLQEAGALVDTEKDHQVADPLMITMIVVMVDVHLQEIMAQCHREDMIQTPTTHVVHHHQCVATAILMQEMAILTVDLEVLLEAMATVVVMVVTTRDDTKWY